MQADRFVLDLVHELVIFQSRNCHCQRTSKDQKSDRTPQNAPICGVLIVAMSLEAPVMSYFDGLMTKSFADQTHFCSQKQKKKDLKAPLGIISLFLFFQLLFFI